MKDELDHVHGNVRPEFKLGLMIIFDKELLGRPKTVTAEELIDVHGILNVVCDFKRIFGYENVRKLKCATGAALAHVGSKMLSARHSAGVC